MRSTVLAFLLLSARGGVAALVAEVRDDGSAVICL